LGAGFIGVSYIVAARASQAGSIARIGGWNWTAAIAVVVAIIISAGLAATIVAIHDRLVETRREVSRIADALEAQNARSKQSAS
jgi:cytosine/uracil/thiamine/allantoin permease